MYRVDIFFNDVQDKISLYYRPLLLRFIDNFDGLAIKVSLEVLVAVGIPP